MNDSQTPRAPLRDVAQNPEAFARYLADIQRVVLDIGASLETLQRETRVHCRGVHVEGDRWYHARVRAMPVEKSLRGILKNVNGLVEGLEKSAHKRRAHEDEVKSLPGKREEKALAKAQRKKPEALRPAPEPAELDATEQNTGYSGPASIYDLGRKSA